MRFLNFFTMEGRLTVIAGLLAAQAVLAAPEPASFPAAVDPASRAPVLPAKVLVILGSSNGAGTGASTSHGDPKAPDWLSPRTSWAGLLTAQLAARGWKVYNRSMSGSYTAVSLQRFFSDIPPLHPRVVLFCTSLENEPGWNTDATTPAVAEVYLAHLKTMIELCRGLGAAPLVVSPYPKNTNDPLSWVYLQKLMAEIDALDVPVFDFLSPAADPGTPGHFLPGISSDGTHVNDVGHAVYASAIDPSVIENATIAPREAAVPEVGAWKVIGNATPAPVVIDSSACPAVSWTVRVLVKGTPGIPSRRFFLGAAAARNQEPLGISTTAAGVYALTGPDGAVLAATSLNPAANPAEHELAITYNHLTSEAILYVDGIPAGAGKVVLPAVPLFLCGGKANAPANAENASFRGFAAWRVPFLPQDLATMHTSHKLLNRSLIASPNFDQAPDKPAIRVETPQP
jgi:lysophospholipase L1-like esterase